jgi:hypothetical protein
MANDDFDVVVIGAGHSGALKLITCALYALEGDPARWEAVKNDYADFLAEQYSRLVVGFQPGDELDRHVMSHTISSKRMPRITAEQSGLHRRLIVAAELSGRARQLRAF